MPEKGSLLYGRSLRSRRFFKASGVASHASDVDLNTGA